MGEPATRHLDYDEYLALERETGLKHEFCEGEVLAMAGGSADHALIALNLGTLVRAALRGGPCRPFGSDWKIWLADAQRAAYPDLSIVCGPIERPPHDPDAATNPVLVAEVISPGTEAHDRGPKARDYRRHGSIQTVLLLDSLRVRVEVQNRNADGSWTLREHGPGERFELPALGIVVEVDALYEDAELVRQ